MNRPVSISTPWEPGFTRKHNLSIAILLVILPFLTPLLATLALVPQLIILTIFIVLIGLPHGALDLTLLRGAGIGARGIAAAVCIYIGLAGLVIVGFDHFPTMALAIFLIVAWIHFGLGDTENLTGWLRSGECFARGGLAIAGPLVFHPQETLDLFVRLSRPDSVLQLAAMGDFARLFICPLWLAVCMLVVGLRLRSALSRSTLPITRREHFLAVWEIVLLLVLFRLWPPLLAFGVYFCFIHSVRHLVQLAAARQPHSLRRASRWLWQESWALVCVTLILGAMLLGYWGWNLSSDTLVLRLLFIGLAALTMPHMLLTYWWHQRGEPVPGAVFQKISS